jgi:hypothetical protein
MTPETASNGATRCPHTGPRSSNRRRLRTRIRWNLRPTPENEPQWNIFSVKCHSGIEYRLGRCGALAGRS